MCLQGAGEAAVLDGGGALVSRVSFDAPGAYVVSGGDGGLYAVASTYSGAEVSRFSGGNFEHALTLETPGVRVFGGNGEFPLICALDDGLYGLDSAGLDHASVALGGVPPQRHGPAQPGAPLRRPPPAAGRLRPRSAGARLPR